MTPTPPNPDPNAQAQPGTNNWLYGAIFTFVMGGLIALAAWLGVGTTPITPPTVPTPPPAVSPGVLSSKNLALVGYMKCPTDGDATSRYNSTWCCGNGLMMRRAADGSKYLLMFGYVPAQWSGPMPSVTPTPVNNGNSLVEISLAGFNADITKAPRASLVNVYLRSSAFTDAVMPLSNPNVSGNITPGCPVFDGSSIFAPFAGFYNTTPADYPCLALSQFQSDGSLKSYGPYFTQAGAKQCRGYGLLAPSAFAQQSLGGNPLLFGAGLTAGNASSSWGPALVSVQEPTTQTQPAQDAISAATATSPKLASKQLAFYAYPDHKCARDQWTGWSVQHNTDGTATTISTVGNTTWSPVDSPQTAVWIKTSAVEGVLFCGNAADTGANVWYGNTPINNATDAFATTTNPPTTNFADPVNQTRGYHSTAYASRCWIYDPADLAAVAAGTKLPYAITPAEVFNPATVLGLKQLNWDAANRVQVAASVSQLFTFYGAVADLDDPSTIYLNMGPAEATSPYGGVNVIAAVKVQP